ncbi:MAG: hypothetical protein ACREQ7_07060 [Candidatus Binatia bacterium]
MSPEMVAEGFLLLALVLIYSVISYGHSPKESGGDRHSDPNERSRNG